MLNGDDDPAPFFHRRANPVWPSACGLDVALLLDRSGSIGSSDMTSLKNAANGFVNSLTGTQSRISVTSFNSTVTPGVGFTLVPNAAAATPVHNAINALPASGSGSTNWDAAFRSVQGAGADIVVILTDGDPTVYGATGNQGSGTSGSCKALHVQVELNRR